MDRIADGFIWPVRDPEWVTKILVMGLTLLIPIIGAINGLGWTLATMDRLRAGEERMAPAGLGYIGRGAGVFLVRLGYGVAVAVVAAAIYLPALLLAASQGNQGNANPAVIVLAVFLFVLAFAVATLGGLATYFATPALVLETYHRGVGGGFDAGSVWRRCRANLTYTLIAGLMLIAAGFLGSIGTVFCFVGVVFTAAYALAVEAWIFWSYELGSQHLPEKAS